MAFPAPTRRPRLASAVLAAVLLAVGLAANVGVARAETAALPVTVTTSSRTGLTDGQTITIHVDAQSPPNAAPSAIYGVEARLCSAGASIDYSADFNPTQTGKCVLHALSGGSDAHTSVALAPPYTTADLAFRVGIGTDGYTKQDSTPASIQCGPSHPCKLVVKLQVPGAVDFVSFPLYYVGDTPPADLFHPLAPTRILDSRPFFQVGPYSTPWTAGAPRDVQVANVGGVPAGADAVVLNATVTGTSAPGYLTIWPAGSAQPNASSLNWSAGQTIPNAVTVKVGAGLKVSVLSTGATTDMVFDVVGYYDSGSGGDGFTSLTPTRIQDSRSFFQVGPYSTPWTSGTPRDVTVRGVGGVPADADAVVLNATVTDTTAGGYLSIWPSGGSQPVASSLNWSAGQTIPNAVTVKVGGNNKVSVLTTGGTTNIVIDVVGYFKVGAGDAFHPLSPTRIQDSRSFLQVGPYSTPWDAGTPRTVKVTTVGGVPSGAKAVLLNATVTDTSAGSWLTIYPDGQSAPTASSLNWTAGVTIPNAVTAKPSVAGNIAVVNAVGTVDVIFDVAGWYGT